ncbi:MAG: hypothetical protein HQ472_04595 [Ignavibacteria bacterium]|nr:hypothetical protein [Ignavibacteria bacterium]
MRQVFYISILTLWMVCSAIDARAQERFEKSWVLDKQPAFWSWIEDYHSEKFNRYFKNGVLNIDSHEDGTKWSYYSLSTDARADFDAQCEVTFNGVNGLAGCGLLLLSNDNYYMFKVSPNNTFWIGRYRNSDQNWVNISPPAADGGLNSPLTSLKPVGQKNTLAVKFRNGRCEFSVNGILVSSLIVESDLPEISKQISSVGFTINGAVDMKVHSFAVQGTSTVRGASANAFPNVQKTFLTDINALFPLKMKDEVATGDYTFAVIGKKVGYIDSDTLTVKFKVDSSERYYYTQCNGISGFEFDAGEGKKWEDGGGSSIISNGTEVRLMGLLLLKGAVTIDTAGGGAKVSGQGDVYFDAVSFGGAVQPFFLRKGSFSFVAPNCGAILDFVSADIVSELSGGKIKEAKLEFLGIGTKAAGAKISGTYEFSKSEKEGCRADLPFGTVWAPGPGPKLNIELGFVTEGATTNCIVGGTVKDFTMGSSWCIKEIKILYDGPKDEISVSGKVKSPFFSEASGGIKFKNGTLNADFELERCIPVPDLPNVCWRGGGFEIENLFIGNPFKGSVNAKFGPYDPLKDLYLLTFECGVEDPPTKVSGSVKGNLLRIEALSDKKPFQVEITGTGSLEPALYKVGLDVTGGAIHLGGDYFFKGKLGGSIGLKPIVLTLAAEGSLTFPKLGEDEAKKLGYFGKFVNAYAPIPFGKASGSLIIHASGDRIGTLNYDLTGLIPPTQESADLFAALRALGKGSLSVDFNRLPSPAAITIDAGFSNLLGGFFGRVQKADGQVQAAEKMFDVPAGQDRLIITIQSQSAGVTTSLKNPMGVVYAKADTVKGVHKVVTPSGLMTLWIVKEPLPGTWTLTSPNAGPTDSISVQLLGPQPQLIMRATIVNNNLHVEWNSADLPSNASILLYTDDNNTGFDGTYLDSLGVGQQQKDYTLADSIAPCKFFVYGVLQSSQTALMQYAPDQLSNPVYTLKPPTGISALSNVSGNTTISWNMVTDPQVGSIGVFLDGTDEFLTAVSSTETSATVQIDNHDAKRLRVVSLTLNGRRSCESEAIRIITDVEEDEWNVVRTGGDMLLAVSPNPAFGSVRIKIAAAESTSGRLVVSDANGNFVFVQNVVSPTADDTITLDTTNFSTGVDHVVFAAGNSTVSQ